MEYVMGIDLGTSSVKAVLMNRDGEIVCGATREYDVQVPKAGYAVQEPEIWWERTKEAVRQAIRARGILPHMVKGVGFSGQMHGLVALNHKGRPLLPAIIWQDQRTKAQQERILKVVREKGLEGELMNKPLAGMLICSLLWVKENRPDIYDQIACVLLPKDYIRYRLGGCLGTDETDAGGSLAFSVRDRTWCRQLLEALDISEAMFPEVGKPFEKAGAVTREAAGDTGLREGTTLAFGGGDSAMQLTGNGIVKEEALCCNIGTASQVLGILKTPLYDKELRTQTLCHSIAGLWYMQCGSLNGGSALRWLKGQILKTEKAYSRLDREAGRVEAGCKGLMFLPFLAGERAPFENPDARGVFWGLSTEHEQAHMVRAVMEGVAMNLGLCYDIFLKAGAGEKQYLVASGGGAKGETWRQILADVFGLPVYVGGSREEACTGAALMGAVALGWYPSVKEAVQQTVKIGHEPVNPISQNVGRYKEQKGELEKLYESCHRLFEKGEK